MEKRSSIIRIDVSDNSCDVSKQEQPMPLDLELEGAKDYQDLLRVPSHDELSPLEDETDMTRGDLSEIALLLTRGQLQKLESIASTKGQTIGQFIRCLIRFSLTTSDLRTPSQSF